MEISLSPELMELLEKLIGVFTRLQSQYLVAIIPAVAIFLLYIGLYGKPLWYQLKRNWLRFRFSRRYGGLAVTLIHQATPTSLFDLFKLNFLTLDDSQKLLQVLEEHPKNKPIHLILHTPGGMVIAAEQIARAIQRRQGETHVYVPQYAMSGGTLIALACTQIHMGPNAILGPLDPQLSIGLFEIYPAVSVIAAAEEANPNRDDKTLILADIARKAVTQLTEITEDLLRNKLGEQKARETAQILCSGKWTHDHGIPLSKARELGLQVDDVLPPIATAIVEALPRTTGVNHGKYKHKEDGQIRIGL
ncbi:hypothetical protein LCGC14_2031940 [marine sediment metagenome]|uniref:Peptidase S49 domain-containing protein n=1 Tax=marine sediment metagenome TaxID=412755 RepID=A0A0F9HRD2_9ZZZZ